MSIYSIDNEYIGVTEDYSKLEVDIIEGFSLSIPLKIKKSNIVTTDLAPEFIDKYM